MRAEYQPYIDTTDALCNDDEHARAIRDQLIVIERVAHEECGSQPEANELPAVFQLDHNASGRIVHTSVQVLANAILTKLMKTTGGDIRKALMTLTTLLEGTCKEVRDRTPPHGLPPLSAIAFQRLNARWANGEDMWSESAPGLRFLGFALVCPPLLDPPGTIRTVTLMTRYGVMWYVRRDRGDDPYAFALPIAGGQLTGVLPHCLARIVGCGLTTPIPVPPLLVSA